MQNIRVKSSIVCIAIVTLLFFNSCIAAKDNVTDAEKTASEVYSITWNWGIDAIKYEICNMTNIRIGVIDSANYYQDSHVTNYSVYEYEHDTTHHGSFIVSALCSMLPGAEFISINVADKTGFISNDALSKGIAYAVDQKCQIISISMGTQIDYNDVRDEILKARQSGCIIVAAAGNGSQTQLDYPANYDGVISVLSRNIDNIDDSTNNVSLDKKSFSAPGSIVYNDCYIFEGSSIATIYVTVEVAYIINYFSDVTYQDICSILEKSCIFSTQYSYGMINHQLVQKNLIE